MITLQSTSELSIHDLTRRSTSKTPPFFVSPWTFNSRPHEEVDLRIPWEICGRWPFNSRPHEEVDPPSIRSESSRSSFNSRPHEEVDEERSDKGA